MKNLLKTEEIGLFLLGAYLFSSIGYNWWWFLLFLFAPDLSMIGYALNTKYGAVLYNLFHHRGIAISLFFIGIYLNLNWLEFTGIILFSHSSLDRILGYGLKYGKGFAYTHLGVIGKTKGDSEA